ncbi:MAG: hypothetical protein ACI4OZ_06095 [Akkermansia sp.]
MVTGKDNLSIAHELVCAVIQCPTPRMEVICNLHPIKAVTIE